MSVDTKTGLYECVFAEDQSLGGTYSIQNMLEDPPDGKRVVLIKMDRFKYDGRPCVRAIFCPVEMLPELPEYLDWLLAITAGGDYPAIELEDTARADGGR